MGVVGRWCGLFGMLVWAGACSGAAPKPAPSPQDKPAATARVEAAVAPLEPSEAERLQQEAKALEARGVADMAARRLIRAYNASGEEPHLVEAARLFELAWDADNATRLYERLAKSPAHAEAARQGLARLPTSIEFDDAQLAQTAALLLQAQRHLEANESARAHDALSAAGKIAWTADVLRALATLDWKLGNQPAAQLGWARTRAARPIELSTEELKVLPTLSWGNSDVLIGPGFVGGSLNSVELPLLQFATANGDLLAYSLEWGTFAHLNAGLFDSFVVKSPPRGKTYASASLEPRHLAFERAKLAPEMGQIVARAASNDGARAAFVSSSGELWVLQDDGLGRLLQVARGPLQEKGRAMSLSLYDSLLAFARTGKDERLYLAPDRTVPMARSEVGEVLELDTKGRVLRRWQAHPKKLQALALTRDGRYLASAAGSEVKVWDLRSLEAVFTHTTDGRPAPFLSFHPSDDVLEVGQEFKVQSIDFHHGRLLEATESRETDVLVHSRDGRYTARGLYSDSALSFSRDRGGEKREVVGALSSYAELSDDGKVLLVSGPALWRFELEPWRATQLSKEPTWCSALSPSGKLVAFWRAQRVEVVDATGKLVVALPAVKQPESLAFAAEDRVALGDGKQLHHFELPSGNQVYSDAGQRLLRLAKGSLIVREDGIVLTSRDHDRTRKIPGDSAFVSHARNAFVVGDARARTVAVYDAANGLLQARAQDTEVPVTMTVSDDLSFVIGAFRQPSYMIWQWDLNRNDWRQVAHGLHEGLSGVSTLTTRGRWVVSGGADGVVVWDTNSNSRGSLNLLEDGRWFSLAHDENFGAVDGAPEAIDHVVNGVYLWHPGSVWEGLRHAGSFGQLLLGKELPGLADFPKD